MTPGLWIGNIWWPIKRRLSWWERVKFYLRDGAVYEVR